MKIKLKKYIKKNANIAFIIVIFLIICGIVVMAKSKAEEKSLITTNNLPSEYTEVEYIESTGTQYIDTNYVPNTNTAIEIQYQITALDNSEEQSIFAIGTTADSVNKYSFSYNNSNLYFRFSNCEITNADSTYLNINKTTIYLDRTNVKYNDTTIANFDGELSLPSDLASTLYLFAKQSDGSVGNYFVGKIYKCIIKENDSIIRNLVPCYRNSDNVAGLYDTTNNVFYTNSGAGNFSYNIIQAPQKAETGNVTDNNEQKNTVTMPDTDITMTANETTKTYIEFDISKASVTIGATYSGKDSSGADVNGTHQNGNEYCITQSDHSQKTVNNIIFDPNSTGSYTVILDNVNMGANSYTTSNPGAVGEININATVTKNISIKLRNENIVRTIRYYTGDNTKSELKITSFAGDGSTQGKLYIPEKKDTQEEIDELVKSNRQYSPWDCGIGGYDSNETVRGLTIAGGDIQVLTSFGDNCTAIGGGGNGLGDVTITGGKIKAIVNGTGTAIGGGVGWGSPGGKGEVTITGGEVFAANYGTGVAIGGGSGNNGAGDNGTVNITGGNVTAISTGKTAIGGGNSTSSNGGTANITISGGTIKATEIGSGYGKDGFQTSTITINGGSINSKMSTQPKNSSGEIVYLTKATLYKSDVARKNTSISSLEGLNNYGLKDIKTDDNGILYLWIPNGKEITGATDNDGIEYIGSVITKEGGTLHDFDSSLSDYIKFDISKAPITIGTTYSGKDSSGADVNGTHQSENKYYITQSDHSQKTVNNIIFDPNSTGSYTVILDNVNMGASSYTTAEPESSATRVTEGEINIDGRKTKNISIKLRNENIVRAIRYYTGDNTKSELKITSFAGDGSTQGKLYIPEKKDTQAEIDKLVNSNTNYNHWNSAIGGDDTNGIVRGLTIAGGDIQVLTSKGDNCTAIGGGNGLGEVKITGGKVKAIANGAGTAIGGGIGLNQDGRDGNVTITGGEVFASNYGEGVAIGGGNSTNGEGGTANVTISGGTVNATKIGSGQGKDGYKPSNVTIDGGSINSIISTQPKNSSGEIVYLTQVTLYESEKIKKNTYISAIDGINDYGLNDVKTDNNGTLYLWIPNGKEITGATDNAGIKYIGSILAKDTGTLVHDNYIIFDVSKAPVKIGVTYSGKNLDGAIVSGNHQSENKYYITQSDHSKKTSNNIIFDSNSTGSYAVILDNINMGLNSYGTAEPGYETTRYHNGEINIDGRKTKNISIKLRNENIVRAIRYYTGNNLESKLKITSFDGDGSTQGKLYIPEKKVTQEEIDELVNSNTNYNHWNSAIGGYDNAGSPSGYREEDKRTMRGLTIAGGDIQVLTSYGDNCSAIGGGGNDVGEVKITGGKVKAIANGTGTAIGGGIGWGSPAGAGTVNITGGEVFAANYGYGVSIGGGSSYNSIGSNGTVEISGGNVTAISTGKTAIGGGNSTDQDGGNANITISGGTVNATSIGSGYGKSGYRNSSVTITGGSINSLISTQPTNGSEPVYLTRATIYESDKIQVNISIPSLEGLNNYGLNDVKTDNNGTLYLWIPTGKEIIGATDSAGTKYEGSIATKAVGMLHHNSSKNYYSVKYSYNNDLTLYTDSELTSSVLGSLTATSGTNISFWVKTNKYDSTNYYSLTTYKSNNNDTMSILKPEKDSNLSNGLYHYTLLLDTDRDIWFETSNGTTNRLSLDLLLGNVVLNDNNVTVGGYTLSNYTGKYYLTSGGTSTGNTLDIESGTHKILADRLVVDTNNSAIRMRSGTLNLSSSSYENSIKSRNAETIYLYNDSNLNLIDAGGSLKLETSKNNTSSISGEGNVTITQNGGFLTIVKNGTASQITAKNYTYKLAKDIYNTKLPYSVTLSGRTMIGYSSDYSGTRKMYAIDKAHTVSRENEFKAIGVEYIDYVESSTITSSISDNNAVFTIQNTPSIAYIENGRNLLTKDTDYTFTTNETTGTLSVKGTSITDHLIVALVNEQEIAVESVDKTYEYDGNPHSIDARAIYPKDNVKFEYREDDKSNWKTETINYTNPGEYTIYWKASTQGYSDKTGSNTITIIPAQNYWTEALTIKSLRLGEEPNPHAVAKWGTDKIKYEYSTTPNSGFTNEVPTQIGGYYVRARIEGTELYTGLVSDVVRFYIEPTAVYIKDLYTMDKLTTFAGIAPSVEGVLSNDKNFSVLYNFLYISDKSNQNYLTINFNEKIPVGTKIALLDFSSGDSIVDAYYCEVENETNSISSNNFKQMGSNVASTFEKGEDGSVYSATYQILVQFPKSEVLPGNITMNLSHKGEIIAASDITIDTTKSNLSGNVELNNIVLSDEKVTTNVIVTNTTTKSNYKNVLAISLYNSDGTTPMVFSPNTIVKIGDKKANIRANIATIEGITNSTYPIEISGLQNGEYKIKASISVGNDEMLSTQFPMNYVKDSKISDKFKIANPEYGIRANIVSLNDNDRIINVSETSKTVVISLNYTAQNISTNPTLITFIQKKNNDLSFSNLSTNELNDWIITKPNLTEGINKTESVSITIPKGQADGAYLINFKIGNAVCHYCIIIDNETPENK